MTKSRPHTRFSVSWTPSEGQRRVLAWCPSSPIPRMPGNPLEVIDPGEKLMAVTGVRPVISKAIEKMRMPQVHEAAKVPEELIKLSKKMVRGELEQPAFPHASYMPLLKDLSEDYNESQVEKMIGSLPHEWQADVGMPYLAVAQRAFQFLQGGPPHAGYGTLAGSTSLRPDDAAYFGFLGKLTILDDVRSVFAMMQCGMLLKSQVECVRLVYPTLSDAIDYCITGAIIDEKTNLKSYQLPVYAEFGVSTWIGKPVETQKFQLSYAVQNQKPPPASNPEETPLSKSSLSSAQQSLYETIGQK